MSTTPRTDEQVLAYCTEDGSELVHASTARELETKLTALQSEFEKVTLLAAQTADRNVELRCRAEKAEAEFAAASLRIKELEDEMYDLSLDLKEANR